MFAGDTLKEVKQITFSYCQHNVWSGCFSVSDSSPVNVNTDLTRINDGWFSIQFLINQQSTLDIVYPSEEKIWDFFLTRSITYCLHTWGRILHQQHFWFELTLDETFKMLLAASTIGVAASTTSPSTTLSWLTVRVLRAELRSTNREPASSCKETHRLELLLILPLLSYY